MFISGDVLLYSAPNWKFITIFPKLIQLITGNKVTHVALYLGIKEGTDLHLILEALDNGVYIKAFTEEELHTRSNGFILCGVARLPQLPQNVIALWPAAKYTTKPYGILTILNLLCQHGKTRIFPKKSWSVWFKSKNAYICSEVTQLVLEDILRVAQVKYTFNRPACLVEPDDYLSSPYEIILF